MDVTNQILTLMVNLKAIHAEVHNSRSSDTGEVGRKTSVEDIVSSANSEFVDATQVIPHGDSNAFSKNVVFLKKYWANMANESENSTEEDPSDIDLTSFQQVVTKSKGKKKKKRRKLS